MTKEQDIQMMELAERFYYRSLKETRGVSGQMSDPDWESAPARIRMTLVHLAQEAMDYFRENEVAE